MRGTSALFSFLFALTVQAQALEPLVEKIEVRVVNVDVTVTDGDGRPVTDLRPEDFEIYEDGVRQEVTGFYAIKDAAARALETGDFTPEPGERFRRKMVLIFDNNSISKRDRDRAIKYVNDFIDNEFSEDYEWSVVAVGGSEVRTLQPFTNDKEAIRSALLEVRGMPTFEFQRRIDRSLLDDPARARLQDGDEVRASAAPSGYDFGNTMRFSAREQTMRNVLATANTGQAIIQTCRAYTVSSGKKVMLLITGGMDMNTTFSAFDSDRDKKMTEMRRELEKMFQIIVREANAANFNIYVVKANGLETMSRQHDVENRSAGLGGSMKNPFFGEGFEAPSDVKDLDSASLTLALGTGGRYLPGNSMSQSLGRVEDATSNFYSLAYRPGGQEDGRYHSIDVRVKRNGVAVQHRAGYLALDEHQRLKRTLRSPLIFSKDKGDLPIRIELGPAETIDSKKVIPVIAALPSDLITFFPSEDRYVGRIHVYVAIYDAGGENVGFYYAPHDLRVPAEQIGQISGIPFRFQANVPLEKGSYTVVITFRDDLSDQFGTAYQDIRI
ncbi:MAG: VWA domain-containing protein [Thermoanaerobaculia bacterium]